LYKTHPPLDERLERLDRHGDGALAQSERATEDGGSDALATRARQAQTKTPANGRRCFRMGPGEVS
jgi:hypothetical protein